MKQMRVPLLVIAQFLAIATVCRSTLAEDTVRDRLQRLQQTERGPLMMDTFVSALDDPAPDVRVVAAKALREIGLAAQPAADKLANLLSDRDPMVRQAAAEALLQVDADQLFTHQKAAVPLVTKILKSNPRTDRIRAAIVLARIGPGAKSAVPELSAAVAGKDAATARWAAVALACIGKDAKPAVEVLTAAVKKGNAPALRRSAAWALGRIGPDAAAAAPILAKMIGDDRFERVDAMAAYALLRFGKASAPALVKLMSSEMSDRRNFAATLLCFIGPDAVPVLSDGLADDNWSVRFGSARVLRQFGHRAQSASDRLIAALEDSNPHVQAEAAAALAEIWAGQAGPPQPVIAGLKKALAHEDRSFRCKAAVALWRLAKDAAAVSVLVKTVEDKEDSVRCDAAEAIREIGSPARPAVGGLLKLFMSDTDFNRRAAAQALVLFPDAADRIVPVMVKALEADEGYGYGSAIDVLAGMGSKAEPAIPRLIFILKEGRWGNQEAAAVLLGRIGPPAKEAVPALMKLLDGGPKIVEAIKRIDPATAASLAPRNGTLAQTLARAIDGSDWSLIQTTCEAIKKQGPAAADAVPVLSRLFDNDISTVASAADALAAIGPRAKDAVPALVKALGHWQFGHSAVAALKAIHPDPDSVLPALTAILNANPKNRESPEGWHRARAAAVIWQLKPSDEALERLIAFLNYKDRREEELKNFATRNEAVRLLGDLGPSAKAAVPALLKAATDPDADFRSQAIRALGEVGAADDRAAAALLTALNDGDDTVRQAAAAALIRSGHPAVAARLARSLRTGEFSIAEDQVESLLKMPLPAALPVLDAALSAAQQGERRMSRSAQWKLLRGIARLGSKAKPLAPRLIAMMSGDSEMHHPDSKYIRADAAAALWKTSHDPLAAEALVDMIKNNNDLLSLLALEALGEMGDDAFFAIPDIVAMLGVYYPSLRFSAAKSLARVGPMAEAAVPMLAAGGRWPGNNEEDIVAFRAMAETLKKLNPSAAAIGYIDLW